MQTIQTASVEEIEAFYAANPGRAEASDEQRRQINAELIAREQQRRRVHAAKGAMTTHRSAMAAPQAPRRTNGPSGRPRASASRSSAASGDSPDDDPAEPAAAPEAAREAVCACWETILRERTPGVAWTVEP